jgi:hypothetical protein
MERTMTEKKLAELLKYSETETCDFKEEIYRVEENDSKVSFLKDVLAMANTIRYEPAYIVVGVRQKGGHNSFVDVDADIDENDFITLIKGNIGPEYPDFTYYNFMYNKHRIGIFEIGISKRGPYFSKKSYGEKVKAGQVYYRYGSVNSEADEEKVREITLWMEEDRNDNYKLIANELELENQDKYNYILLIGEEYQFSKQQYDVIANMKWSLIIDYSTNGENGGLQKSFRNERVAVHNITPEQSKLPPFYEDKTLFWYFAPNIKRKENDGIDARAWSTKYFNSVNQCIGKVVASVEKRVIFVSLFMGECRYKSVDNLIDANANGPLFYKHIDFSRGLDFSILNEDTQYVEIQCLCDDICEAFAHNKTISVSESEYYLLQEEKLQVNTPFVDT